AERPNSFFNFSSTEGTIFSGLWLPKAPFMWPPYSKGHLAGTGTGITSFPSDSATKDSLLELEDPLPSLLWTLITSFRVGINGSFALPDGPGITDDACFTSSGVSLRCSILLIFEPMSLVIIVL